MVKVGINGNDHYRDRVRCYLFPNVEENENRIISRNGDVSWPQRSSGLTPLNYFLWRAVDENILIESTEWAAAI